MQNSLFLYDTIDDMKNHLTLNAIIEKSEDGWYVGQLEEMPEVLSQGRTVRELLSNLKDALNMILEDRKENILKSYSGKKIMRRKVTVT
jgi:predicted RNase H-like HicB family nuclease